MGRYRKNSGLWGSERSEPALFRWLLPNDNAHQLRALKPAPAQTYIPQRAQGAVAERRLAPTAARRLHARVRRPVPRFRHAQWMVSSVTTDLQVVAN